MKRASNTEHNGNEKEENNNFEDPYQGFKNASYIH